MTEKDSEKPDDDVSGTRGGGDVGAKGASATSNKRGGGTDRSKGWTVKDDPPSYDDESMPIDPPDNTGGGGW